MDTERDFLFFNERIATKYNPFYEGEYLVIQSYPREQKLIVEHRTFDYKNAKSHCELENLAHDYTSFSLRIFHDDKLWEVNYKGEPQSISKQQNWRIAQEYLEAHYSTHTDAEMVVCQCSYPYFSSLTTHISNSGESMTSWQALTCLVRDLGRDIQTCPNCNLTFPVKCLLQAASPHRGRVILTNLATVPESQWVFYFDVLNSRQDEQRFQQPS